MKPPDKRAREVIMRMTIHLIMGRRLEIQGPGKLVLYVGQSLVLRDDPYWYEHPGGRTYKRTPREVLEAILPHVGTDALERAKVHST